MMDPIILSRSYQLILPQILCLNSTRIKTQLALILCECASKSNSIIFQKELHCAQPPPCNSYFQLCASNQTNCHKSGRNGLGL